MLPFDLCVSFSQITLVSSSCGVDDSKSSPFTGRRGVGQVGPLFPSVKIQSAFHCPCSDRWWMDWQECSTHEMADGVLVTAVCKRCRRRFPSCGLRLVVEW